MNFQSSLVNSGSTQFKRALAISLVLHAMLLFQKSPVTDDQSSQAWLSRQAAFLNASLRNNTEPPAPAASSRPRVVAKPKPIRNQHTPIPVHHQPDARHLPLPRAGGAAPAGEGLDANGLRQYRLGLAAAARGFKLYPPQALENGWSGTAEIRLAVAADGAAAAAQLVRSSGHEVLDAAAIAMVDNAAQRTALPASLRGQSFSLPLPVVFDFDDK